MNLETKLGITKDKLIKLARTFFGNIKKSYLLSTGKFVEGTLLVQKVFNDGTKETVFNQDNLIMLTSKQYLLSALYTPDLGDNFAFDPIVSLKIGTGGTIDTEGLFPRDIDQSLTGLFVPVPDLTLTTDRNVDNIVPSVTFIVDINQGTANDMLITEAGLFKLSGAMFNIKVFPGIFKKEEFSLHFEWTIKMA